MGGDVPTGPRLVRSQAAAPCGDELPQTSLYWPPGKTGPRFVRAEARLCGRQIRTVKLRRRVCNSRRPHQSGTQLGQGRRLGGKSTQRTRGVNVKIAVDKQLMTAGKDRHCRGVAKR